MKLLSYFLLSASLITMQVCHAEVPKPTKCPSAEAIRAVGVNKVEEDLFSDFVVFHEPVSNYYDTAQPWYFNMYINAKSPELALMKANEELKSLKSAGGPSFSKQGKYLQWSCKYLTSTGHVHEAVFAKKE